MMLHIGTVGHSCGNAFTRGASVFCSGEVLRSGAECAVCAQSRSLVAVVERGCQVGSWQAIKGA